ncbi:hypothetical protein F4703DRAFT_1263759 [Phycomyces blakesleeanus]
MKANPRRGPFSNLRGSVTSFTTPCSEKTFSRSASLYFQGKLRTIRRDAFVTASVPAAGPLVVVVVVVVVLVVVIDLLIFLEGTSICVSVSITVADLSSCSSVSSVSSSLAFLAKGFWLSDLFLFLFSPSSFDRPPDPVASDLRLASSMRSFFCPLNLADLSFSKANLASSARA